MKLNILVYGVNGAQMAAGTQALVEAGHNVRAFTRSHNGAERWRKAGVDVAIGEMSDIDVLRTASEGQDAIFLHVPIVRDDEAAGIAYGLNTLKAAKAAGIKKVIWNTSVPIMDFSSETDPGAVILRALQEEGFSFLALTPTLYVENLLGPWTTNGFAKNVLAYPTPSEFKVQWVAARDFGRVADKALQGELPDKVIALGGPSALSGHELAQIVGEKTGQSLGFETLPAAEFQKSLEQIAGHRVGAMVGGMYAGIQASPEQFQPGFLTDADETERCFGLKLTPLSDWVDEYKGHLLASS